MNPFDYLSERQKSTAIMKGSVAAAFINYRMSNDLTQAELAERFHVSAKIIEKIENGDASFREMQRAVPALVCAMTLN